MDLKHKIMIVISLNDYWYFSIWLIFWQLSEEEAYYYSYSTYYSKFRSRAESEDFLNLIMSWLESRRLSIYWYQINLIENINQAKNEFKDAFLVFSLINLNGFWDWYSFPLQLFFWSNRIDICLSLSFMLRKSCSAILKTLRRRVMTTC